MFSSHQEYCALLLAPRFHGDMGHLSPEKGDQNCEISRSRIMKETIDEKFGQRIGLRSSW